MRRPRFQVAGGRKPKAQARCLPADLMAAIESATLSRREDDGDGPRTVVISHALGGAFYFYRETAAERFRKFFRGLGHEDYARAINFLESRVRLLHAPYVERSRREKGWVYGWRENSQNWMGRP